jgi:hypothetical protein
MDRGGFSVGAPIILTYEISWFFLRTTVFEPSRPQAVLLVEIFLLCSQNHKSLKQSIFREINYYCVFLFMSRSSNELDSVIPSHYINYLGILLIMATFKVL